MNPVNILKSKKREGRDSVKSAVIAKMPGKNRAADNSLDNRAQSIAGKQAIDRTKLPPKVTY